MRRLTSLFSLVLFGALSNVSAQETAGEFLVKSLEVPRSLQRTSQFFGIENAQPTVQIAFVVDGTDSMGKDINSLKTNLQKLVKGLSNINRAVAESGKISFALVVYRDKKSPTGSIDVVVPSFSSNLEEIRLALENVSTETGDPYFQERVDEGVHAALTKLDWSPADQPVSRWLVLCGDAPPYPEHDKEKRLHTTSELVDLANKKDVTVYSIRSRSGFKAGDAALGSRLLKTAKAERPATNKFFGDLAQQTGGKFLDMWDQDAVTSMLEAKPLVVHIKRIDEAEIFAVREDHNASSHEDVRLAVVPHVGLQADELAPKDAGVKFANVARMKLAEVPGLKVASVQTVSAAMDSLRASSTKWGLPELADKLDVDYLVWGKAKEASGHLALKSSFYTRFDSTPLATAETIATSSDLQPAIVTKLIDNLRRRTLESLKALEGSSGLFQSLDTVDKNESLREQFVIPLAKTHDGHNAIAAAIGHAWEASSFINSPDTQSTSTDAEQNGIEHTKRAIEELTIALEHEPENAFAHMLIANCYFNLSKFGDSSEELKPFYNYLQKAYTLAKSDDDLDERIKTEIEAQYALFVTKDIHTAVKNYRELAGLTGTLTSQGDFALRANWVLAGIHLGDWHVREYSPETLDVKQAREHILAILAHWPSSNPANFYRSLTSSGNDGPIGYEIASTTLRP